MNHGQRLSDSSVQRYTGGGWCGVPGVWGTGTRCVTGGAPVVRVRASFPTVSSTVTPLWPTVDHFDHFGPFLDQFWTVFGQILTHFGLILACFWLIDSENGPLFRPFFDHFHENHCFYPFSQVRTRRMDSGVQPPIQSPRGKSKSVEIHRKLHEVQ